jgi:hypothetical protein
MLIKFVPPVMVHFFAGFFAARGLTYPAGYAVEAGHNHVKTPIWEKGGNKDV